MRGAVPAPTLSDRQRRDWLRLIRTENVGPATFRGLIERFGSAEAAIEALPRLTGQGSAARFARIPSPSEAEAEIEAAEAFGARFIALGEPDYPAMLALIDAPPPLIVVKGDPAIFRLPPVAIVGARNASLAGLRMARAIAGELATAGHCVVSGLARGIDAAAHEAALATGTVAVMAGGLDRPYPPENVALLQRIGEGPGAAVSEMPFGWEPRAKDFPRRNRIVAGLSLGLVVVEAALRSGSLISARLANEMGRLVFAVPGSPLDPRAAGANGLLKEGAILVTEARDIIDALAPLMERPHPPKATAPAPRQPELFPTEAPGDSDRDRIVKALGPVPTQMDEVIHHTGLHPSQVSMILLELDLAGRIERHPGNMISLLSPP